LDGGATNVGWTQGNNRALFTSGLSGSPGTIALGEAISAGGLVFDLAGYTIAGGANALTLDLGDNTTPSIVTNADATITAILAGNDGFRKDGTGQLTLTGSAVNTFTGTTIVDQGILVLDRTGVPALGGDLTINGGAVRLLRSNQIEDTATVTLTAANSVFNGTGANAGGTDNLSDTFANLLVTGGAVNTARTATGFVVTGTTSFTGGAGNSVFVGNSDGTFTTHSLNLKDMTGVPGNPDTPNSFTVYGNSSIRRTALNIGAGGLTLDNSRLVLRAGGADALGSVMVLDGNITTTGTAASFIEYSTVGGTTGGTVIELSSTAAAEVVRTFNIGGDGANLTVTAPISNGAATAAGILKTGVGTLTLGGGEANTYSGLTTVDQGTLRLNKTAGVTAIAGDLLINTGGALTLSTADQLAATTHLQVEGGTINALGQNQTFASYTQTAGGLTASGNTGDITITGKLSLLGGNTVTLNSGSTGTTALWVVEEVELLGAGILLGGNSGAGADRTTLTIGSGGLTIQGQTITLYRGNSGTLLNLHGDVTSGGNAAINPGVSGALEPLVDFGTGVRTINVVDGLLNLNVAVQASAADLVKTGAGQLSILEAAAYTGTTHVDGGTLLVTGSNGRLTGTSGISASGGVFQNGSPIAASNNGVTDRINPAAGLTLGGANGGGTFTHAAAETGQTHTQTLASLTVDEGFNVLNTTASTGTNTLTFSGPYTRLPDGWLDIVQQTGFDVVFATDPLGNGSSVFGTGANAILAGALLNGTDFVRAQSGSVTAATYVDTGTAVWLAGANMNVTGSNGIPYTSETINTLRFNDSTVGHTVTLQGAHTIASGVILVTSNVGAHDNTLAGGTIQAGAGEPLMIIQDNTAGQLHISSDIVTSGDLVKSGAGLLHLSGNNTYAGATEVLGGVLRISGGGLSASSNLQLDGGVLETSGTFDRSLGGAANEVQILGGAAGFSAFGGALAVNLGGSGGEVVWGSPFFSPDTFVLNAASADSALDFQNGLDLNGAVRTIQSDAASSLATLSGVIRDVAGGGGLRKTGAGSLEVTNENTYGGTTTLDGGTLLAGHDSAFGSSEVVLRGGTFGAIGGDRVFANDFRLEAVATVFFSGSHNIRIDGSLTAVGTTATDFTNTLTAGNTLELAGDVFIAQTNSPNVLRIFGTGTTLISGVIANNPAENTAAGHLHFNSSGLLRLTGTNTYTGSTLAANSGAIAVSADANFGAAPDAPYIDNIILAAGGRLLIEDSFELNANRHIGIGNAGGGTNTGTIQVNSGVSFTVGGVVADRTRNQDQSSTTPANVGSLRKTGLGALVLGGDNTYSGITTVSNGVLRLGSNSALGASGPTSGTTVTSGAQVELMDGVVISGEEISINGSGIGSGTAAPGSADVNRGALQAAAGASAEWAGTVILASAGTNRVGAQAGGTLLISGIIDDGANNHWLEIGADSDNGTVILSGANTYGDGVTALTRTVRGTTKLGAHNTLPTVTTLDIHFASSNNAELSTLDMNGFNQAIRELINSGNSNTTAVLTNSSTTLSTLTLNQPTDTTYGGIITGNLSLVKNGAGVLELTRFNTYDGDTVINEGTLRASGGGAIADSGGKGNVVLDGGDVTAGTLDLRNTEMINGLDGTAGTVLGRVVNDSATATAVSLRLGAGQADGVFAGQILDNSGGAALGTISLVKVGAGTQTLSGQNAFSGAIVVYNGTLLLDYETSDPLNGNVVRLSGGTLHLKGSSAGTSDSFGTLNYHASTFNQIVVDQSAGGSSTWATTGLTNYSGGGGAQGLLLLDRSSGADLTTTASFSGIFQSGGRAIAYVRDSTGTGFMTKNANNELVRYTGYSDSASAADDIVGNNAGDSSQAYGTSSNLKMTASVARTANLNFATLLVEALADDIVLDMGTNDIFASASNGRSILITGTEDFTLTGGAGSTINESIYITSLSEGKTTLDIGMAGGMALVTGGTGFMEYTRTVVADVYAAGNLLRLTGEQNYQNGVLRLSSGGVLEIGADLDTATADADFTRILGTNTRLYGDTGFSAYTTTPGGVRVVRLGTTAAGDGGTLTWGSGFFLVSQESSTFDIDAIFKLSSDESNATVEFQNPINLNSRTRTVEVANGSADIDARLTGELSSPGGGMVKTGLGSLEVTNANTYGGGTEIRQGTFLAGNSSGSATGTGNVRVRAGARLGGTGTVGSSTSNQHLTADTGSTVMVGNTHGADTGAGGAASVLALQTSGTGVIALTGTLEFDLFANNDGINPTGNNDVLQLTSEEAIVLEGTLTVANSTGTDSTLWLLDTTWQLFDWSNVSSPLPVTGTFNVIDLPTLDANFDWDLSQLYTLGTIRVAPEPSRALLLVAGLASLLLRRRRGARPARN
jgi:autotransporter-associated beta strand protein